MRWGECYVCGFEFPYEQLQRHYKTQRLVDEDCADEFNNSDYREMLVIFGETRLSSEQPVSSQGQSEGLYEGQDVLSGAGMVGAGRGGPGGAGVGQRGPVHTEHVVGAGEGGAGEGGAGG